MNIAELILYNGKIVTINKAFEVKESVAIKDGKFLAVGTNEEIQAFAGEGTEWIDLQGKTVIPGLIDSHIHASWSANQFNWVRLEGTKTIDDILQLILERVKITPPGKIIMGGGAWHENQLEEGRMLTRWDLDKVSPDHPVVILRGGHIIMCNTKTLQIAGISQSTLNPEHGLIIRDQATGELTGILIENATKLVEHLLPKISEEQTGEQILAFMADLNSYGVTGMTDPLVTHKEIAMYKRVFEGGKASVRTQGLYFVASLKDIEDVFSVYSKMEGDDFFRIAGVKSGADGGVEGAWMLEPYGIVKGQQEDPNYRGIPFYPEERVNELREMLKLTAREGWQMQIHVAGDAATKQIVDLYAEVGEEIPINSLRWVVMHVMSVATESLEKMKEIGCIATVQNHPYLLGKNMINYWGHERAANAIPLRSMLDLDIQMGGGTDAPIVPWNPFVSIWWMVTRKLVDGTVLGAHEAISREEALRLWTVGSAYTQFNEDKLGSIEPGKLADLAVLSDDILTVPEDQLKDLYAELTYVGGKIIYKKHV